MYGKMMLLFLAEMGLRAKQEKKPQDAWVKYSTTPFIESLKAKDRRLNGQFEGTLTHKDENEGRIDTVVRKEYSRNAGNGGNRALKGSDLADAYYVEASPNSYFQINLKDYPQVTGQYFEKEN